MITTETEYRKGILFVRPKGRLINERFIEEITKLIAEMDIRYIALNLENINNLSLDNIRKIKNYQDTISKENKTLFIIDKANIRTRPFQTSIICLNSELETFSYL